MLCYSCQLWSTYACPDSVGNSELPLCCTAFGVQVKKVNDEREAAENARIAADVAAADKRAQEGAEKLAEKRRKMQQDCDKAGSVHVLQPPASLPSLSSCLLPSPCMLPSANLCLHEQAHLPLLPGSCCLNLLCCRLPPFACDHFALRAAFPSSYASSHSYAALCFFAS